MSYFYLKSVLCYLLINNLITVDSAQCCSESDLYVLRREQLCWDPFTNLTLSVNLDCKHFVFIRNFTERNGSLVLMNEGKEVGNISDHFCFSDIVTGNISDPKFILSENIRRHVAVACAQAPDPKEPIFGYCLIVSVIFLALTAFIYSFFQKLRDLFGKSIICFCTSMAIGLGILSILKLMSYRHMGWCAVRGFLTYFFLLSGYFWSNAILIQILLCTRAPALFNAKRSFLWYSLYAWGVPAVLTISMIIVNYYPADHDKPGIGLNTCWFSSEQQRWYYMYSVMSILIIANICIFIYTSTLVWHHSFSSSHINVMRFKLCLMIRLVVLTGLFWIFEMISSVTQPHILWVIVDIFNTLHGFFIFVVLVVLRPRVIKIIHEHGYFFCLSNLVEKCLALVNDAEENCIVHTEVAMSEQ